MVVPSLAALLAQPSGVELLGQKAPTLDPVLRHELDEAVVFLGRPRTLDQTGTEDLLPSVETLDVGAIGEGLGNLLPVPGGVGSDSLAENGILGLGPFGGGRG